MVKKMKNKFGTFLLICVCPFLWLNFLVFSGVALYFFERDAQPDVFGSITNAIIYVALNFLTIGYSGIGPLSFGGKLICIVGSILGGFLGVAIFIGIVVWIYRFISSNMRTRSNVINS